MIRRSTWITLAVFGVVLAFALWWTKAWPTASREAQATPPPEPLWEVQSSDVADLRIDDLDEGRAVEVRRREEGGWEVVSPQGAVLGDDVVEMAVIWLASPRPRAVLSPGGNLADYGLAPPVARITLSLRDGSSRVLEVGGATPGGTTTYVRLPGAESVLVVSKYGLSQVLTLVDSAFAPTETPAPGGSPETPPRPG